MGNEPDFSGAKLVLLIGGQLLTLLRCDRPDIPFPGCWDLPGGGREGRESAEDCALRETFEEVGLRLEARDLVWRAEFAMPARPGARSIWFGASLSAEVARDIRFGDEGQGWALVPPLDWLIHPKVVPHFPDRVRLGLETLTKCLKNRQDSPISGPLSAAFRQELS